DGETGGGALPRPGGQDDVGVVVAGVLHRRRVHDVDPRREVDVRTAGAEARVAEPEAAFDRLVGLVGAGVGVLRGAVLGHEVVQHVAEDRRLVPVRVDRFRRCAGGGIGVGVVDDHGEVAVGLGLRVRPDVADDDARVLVDVGAAAAELAVLVVALGQVGRPAGGLELVFAVFGGGV